METPLTILYTYGLRGDLEALPRLYTFIQQLKAHYSQSVVQVCADDPAPPPGRILLLDLGESCAPDVWHCEVSGGRSTLVVLDGMGYDAALVSDAKGKRAKLGDSVRLKLAEGETPLKIGDAVMAGEDRNFAGLQIAAPAPATQLDDGILSLAAPGGAGQIGAAQLVWLIGRWSLVTHEIHDLPRRVLPDPTIAASVDFVLSEARYAQKRRSP